MSPTTSGLSSGSGIDYTSWITALVAVKQAKIDKISAQVTAVKTSGSALSTVKSYYSGLSDSIQKITDAKLNSVDNVFTKKAATSSSEAITAVATAGAIAQTVKVSVSNLASNTKAQSASVAGAYVNGATQISDISEGAIKNTTDATQNSGVFSIYYDGVKTSITVDKTQSLSTVVDSLKAVVGSGGAGEGNAQIIDGKLSITAAAGHTVSIGSTSDTSNFASVVSLVKDVDGNYASSKPLFETNTSTDITSAKFAGGVTVTAGKFIIGTEEFTVDSTKTIDSLVSEINNSKKANASAYWDSNSGKLVLESKEAGAVNINIEIPAIGGSNFTDIMKLTTVGALAAGSQTLGENAKLTINGTEITSTSNTITSDISGISGLTLTLNDKTTSTATVTVAANNSAVTSAINSFVSAFNTAMTQTDTSTSKTGYLKGESILSSMKSRLRMTVTADVTGKDGYKTLASIGITTGAWSTDASAKTTTLVVDSDKLSKALAENPDAVMKLLVGDTNTDGVLTKLATVVDNSLNATNGYFAKRASSYDTQVTRLNSKISRQNSDLKTYQASLEKKFQAMDKLISNLQNQASQLDSMMSQINGSNKKD